MLHVVVQTAPAVRIALGEDLDIPTGSIVTGRMVTALKRLGFDSVLDTDFSADLTIMEEGTELLTRLKRALVDKDPTVKLPMIWITLQTHKNVMAIASLKELAAIILVGNQQPEDDTVEQSNTEGIPVLGTSMPTFEITGKLYNLLR